MKKQQKQITNNLEKHCVVFIIQEGNGTKLYEYLKQDSKLTPIHHWVQGEWNETKQPTTEGL